MLYRELTEGEIRKKELEYRTAHTNHILHLILSILTGGFWIIIWIIVSILNSYNRSKSLDDIAAGKTTTFIGKIFYFILYIISAVFIFAFIAFFPQILQLFA